MIIVTGATGFIGSNLLAELENRGYTDIVGIDNFGTDNKWMNVAKRNYVKFVSPENTFSFLKANSGRINAIVHLGAISTTTECDVDLIFRSNIQLTIDLYDFCKKHYISFIYASSAATYGLQKANTLCDDKEDLTFLQSLMPLNPYGWSKLYVDKYISADRSTNTPTSQVVGLKFFNVYGPNEYHKGGQSSVMFHFYNQLKEHGYVKVFRTKKEDYPNGAARDFVHVDDCVDVIIWMLEHSKVSGLFNVGSGTAASYEMVVENTAKWMSVKPQIEYIDMPQALSLQYQYYTQADIQKLRSVGYGKEMSTIQEGIEKYNRYLNTTGLTKYK